MVGSALAQQDPQEGLPEEKTDQESVASPDLDIQDGGRNAGEPENADRRSKTRIFSFYAELYARYKDKEQKETDNERHTTGVIATASAQVEANFFDGERSDLTGEFRFRRNFDSRAESADWSDYDLTLDFRSGDNSIQTTLFSSPDQLSFISDGKTVLRDQNGVEIVYGRRLSRRFRVRTRYEFSREIFTDQKERDFAKHKVRIDFKHRFHRLFNPGVGFQMETRRAKSDNFDRKELSPVFLLTSRFRNRAILSLTYRYRFREHTTADMGASNFLREDQGPRLSFTSYLRVRGTVWLRFFGTLERVDSTQLRRDFSKKELGMGLRYYFP